MRNRTQRALAELLLLMLNAGCQRSAKHEPVPPTPMSSAIGSAHGGALDVAGRFVCRDGACRQAQPRLPDTGEWRCAEREHVVWCAGGEPAAGVVAGDADAHFRCGPRWHGDAGERVCIDAQPEYPAGEGEHYRCRFEQERRTTRVCQPAEPAGARPLPARALPACWLDRDCPAGVCDRGACACTSDSACISGRCEQGTCTEAAR